ncbi:MAG: glycosyltransferase family 2 protein [Bacteroidia bacterium]|nr:glycosyltransferase family 2 protein [Bacteroidia bacterium]
MHLISAVIIAYNEELNIGRCLDSLAGVADEIVVVDNHSSDRTAEICRAYGARVHPHAFEGYVSQKNLAISLATHDWVLSLDADEALDVPLKAAILAAKNRDDYDAWRINRLNHYCGRPIRTCGWYPDARIRLADRRKAAWTGYVLHEELTATPDARIGHLPGDILHYSYPTVASHLQKATRYAQLGAEDRYARGTKAPYWKLIVKPAAIFWRRYLLQGGWRDGYYGWIICAISAWETFAKYALLREKYQQHR